MALLNYPTFYPLKFGRTISIPTGNEGRTHKSTCRAAQAPSPFTTVNNDKIHDALATDAGQRSRLFESSVGPVVSRRVMNVVDRVEGHRSHWPQAQQCRMAVAHCCSWAQPSFLSACFALAVDRTTLRAALAL